ncbi:GntR family transcriptional regulator [Algibacillus agarilyticus]|uniref:GntR family transcriptional regulator n=1 Tax=Algibacillus agarilyticus TaxID=2234133 RepID=UPI000DCFEF79|nr:GntR family transcriptional regulator [Algibacillus agarilyticus]
MKKMTPILTVRDQIAEQIRLDIISGELAPTSKLNEQDLATRFGVSRGPIRDVLLQLTKEGLLSSKSNCGVTVSNALDPELQILMSSLREKIEIHAVRKLKNKLSDDDINELNNILLDLELAFEKEDFIGVTQKDVEFHRYLISAAGGEQLVNIWYPIMLRLRLNYDRIAHGQECVDEHKVIVDSLAAGNISQAVTGLKENIR